MRTAVRGTSAHHRPGRPGALGAVAFLIRRPVPAWTLLAAMLVLACTDSSEPAAPSISASHDQTAGARQEPASCAPTRPDALGPFYVPNAPARSSVGGGHVLSGVVRSSEGCAPIAGARIEFWLANPRGQYDAAHRATLFADADGAYRFESNFPPAYSGRPPHVHIRVTAEGFQELVTQYYPSQGQAEGEFDLVLVPAG